MKKRLIIMGAGGRDFHNFNVCYRNNPDCEILAFTAAQIPFIMDRSYPQELAGPLYPEGIPILPEENLPSLIRDKRIDEVVFSYSDVSHEYIMHRASLVTALGASFSILGADATMLKSSRPVISVCSVRTGCGKSGVTRYICRILMEMGINVIVIRHPMAYRDLLKQRVQKCLFYDDLAGCTIEEREEFEPMVEHGIRVYAGVDYWEVLKEAEKEESDVIVWDGGNNDLPFLKPDIEIVILDPLRPGHELSYYPGEANLRRAHCLVINKMDTARPEDVETVLTNARSVNENAQVVYTSSTITVENGYTLRGKKVLVVEDGPTLTHGGMTYGAGIIAAKMNGAEPVDPRPYAVRSIRETLYQYNGIKNLLPAMGYSPEQLKDLEETINNTPCDMVLIATPVDLTRLMRIKRPGVRVVYEVEDMGSPNLRDIINRFCKERLKSDNQA